MTYSPTTWVDFPSTSTPINAARLNNMESGISAAVVQGPNASLTGPVNIGNDDGTSAVLTVEDEVIGSGNERAHIYGTMYNPPASGQKKVLNVTLSGRGTATVSQRGIAIETLCQDSGSVVNKTVTNAVNNGSGLIRITAATHTFATGDKVAVYGVGGVTNANGAWTVTVIDANTLDLQGSTFAGSYTSGGTVTNRPMMTAFRGMVSPTLARGGLTGTAAAGDDLDCFTAENVGTQQATDAFYVSASSGVVGNAWGTGLTIDAKCGEAIVVNSVSGVGLQLSRGTFASGAIVIPNNSSFRALNVAGNATTLFRMNTSDELAFISAPLFISDLYVRLGTSTGTKFGTATNEKIGFWNKTPVVQPNTTGTTTGFSAGAGSNVLSGSTFTGNTGSAAYTIGDIVKALKDVGLMAA